MNQDIHALPERIVPASIDAEQALLGAILASNHAFERISGAIEGRHFFDPLHADIFDTAAKLIQAGKVANPVTMATFFANAPPLADGLTVPQYLGRLVARATSLINAADYARHIRDCSMRRGLILLGEDIVNAAFDANSAAPAEQIELAERRLFSLQKRGDAASSEVTLASAVSEAMKIVSDAYQRQGDLAGHSTGFRGLDAKTGGLMPGNLIIIAGRPGMGKTALATNIARSFTKPGNDGDLRTVHFFSQEMSAAELGLRLISEEGQVPSYALRRGSVSEEQVRTAWASGRRLGDHHVIIDETGGLSLAQVVTRARRIKRREGTELIIIDYLQLMAGSNRENRTQDITEITKGLKALSKELSVPVIALSQLSREVEKRADKRPQLSDLRESGSIEQDADLVLFCFREEYYLERAEPDAGSPDHLEWHAKMRAARGTAEIIVGKNRHGPVGIVPMRFESALTRFLDAEDGETGDGRGQ